ncbi:hypothetical protein GGQ84_000762 [Desulfitispora alkaliphila]|uniref:C4-dicarboxylate ABC transporter n=1 Tax=Desulfitispora alkaliphila TaxID=622674 RepID=UPI003D1F6224
MNTNDRLRSTATLMLAVLYLVSVLFQASWLEPVISILLVAVLFSSLVAVKGTARVIGFGLFMTGGLIFFIYRADWSLLFQGLERNLYLVTMFIMVPLLSIPIRRGGYLESLKGFFGIYVKRDFQFYLFVKAITFFISVLINVGSVPLMYQISAASEKSRKKRLLAAALIRGFTASILWAPSYAAVALIIDLTGGSWIQVFPYGFGFGLMAILVGTAIQYYQELKDKDEKIAGNQQPNEVYAIKWKKLLELIGFSCMMIILVVIISHFTYLSTVTAVATVSLIYPIFWLGLIGRARTFFSEVKESYYNQSLPKLKNEVVLFMGAGFFATAVDSSNFGDVAVQVIYNLAGDSQLLLSTGICMSIILLSAVGVHPIISVTLVGSILEPSTYGVSETFLGVLLLSGWSLGIAVSPSSATVITASSLVGSTVLRSCKWNVFYTFVMFGLFMLALNGLHLIGLI